MSPGAPADGPSSLDGRGLVAALWPQGPGLQREFLRDASRPLRDGGSISYAAAQAGSARLAHALRSLGVRAGDRVAVQVEKSTTAVLLYLAVLRLGAVYLPLNTAYTEAELDYFLTDAEPTLWVVTPERAASLQALAARLRLPALATLGADGRSGSLVAVAESQSERFEDVARDRKSVV